MPYRVVATQSLGNNNTVVTFHDGSILLQRTYPAGYQSGVFVFPPPLGADFLALPEVPVGIPIGATVSRLVQDVAVGGNVNSQDWELSTGQKVTNTYTYGPNSNTIPTQVSRGTGTVGTVLSRFRLNTAGTQILYDLQNGAVATVTGSIGFTTSSGRQDRDVSHNSQGVMTIATTGIPSTSTNLILSAYISPLPNRAIVNQPVLNLSTVP
jgi:hypothetical protein